MGVGKKKKKKQSQADLSCDLFFFLQKQLLNGFLH